MMSGDTGASAVDVDASAGGDGALTTSVDSGVLITSKISTN